MNASKLVDEQFAMLDEVVQAVGVANYLRLEIPSNLTVCDLGTIAKGVVGGELFGGLDQVGGGRIVDNGRGRCGKSVRKGARK